MVRRVLVAGYGAAAYVFFLVTFLYTIGFLAGVGVPKDVDDGPSGPAWLALLVDTGLLTLFAVQHSVMARPWFKRWWTRWVAPPIERSTYVLAATLAVAALLWLWRPLPETIWSVPDGWLRWLFWAGHLAGWGLLLLSTFQIGHFDLFGLRQVLARLQRRQYTEPGFAQPFLYRLVRHPLMLGFLIAFWITPDMSVGRLYFAVVASAYIVVAVRFEEHDLVGQLGDDYRRYQRDVPRFVPRVSSAADRRRPARVESR
ncbi:methanethiol S-methyltransferase [Cryptosporangium aurantiacum]|uniref:methanethiol S-methyltransferase n=1 Tax=Cryptosporangium aurantiacum TaxID=134849 RepID=A0A1M7RB02_9ACTN|nr:methanethiol S-methyltransferase [Cryptosporangium aurantiacum]SHN43396.1 Protein-S-isoprenylcysteine O-methyltransferase Ste14 [Cryptosporangium aurantiacum]